ncbi:MAG TPA: hypothetical protein VGP70_00490 [Actinomadura sp.]|jgi:hypothetical protein|nr:hypothetical protein [Actinomadura sp.]
MPCYRCGARQTDPARGASPWKRGVRRDRLVLICPGCQGVQDWTADLDRCASCGATALVCRLGEVECRQCGHVRSADATAEAAEVGETPGLSEEVAQALDRVLGKGPPAPGRGSGRDPLAL